MKSLVNLIIDYIFPPTCVCCAEFTLDHEGFCARCWNEFDFIVKPFCRICGFKFEISTYEDYTCARCIQNKPSYDFARASLVFNLKSKKLIHAFKYHDKTEAAKIFAKLICARYHAEISQVDYITAVPMNRFKRLFRMYNQSEILGRNIAKILKKPFIVDILIKRKWTKTQTSLSKAARINNLAGSIKSSLKYNIKGKDILLVDDVMTTGATIEQCCRILKAAGAHSVKVVTIANTPI